MKKAILATKIGMTQIFAEDGSLIPVTVLKADPAVVTQVKTVENDGYGAVQVGFGDIRENLVNKPKKGHFAKAGVPVKRFLREFKLEDAENYKAGDEIKADVFAAGDKVDATATSKGKGFQGAIHRHGLHSAFLAKADQFVKTKKTETKRIAKRFRFIDVLILASPKIYYIVYNKFKTTVPRSTQ